MRVPIPVAEGVDRDQGHACFDEPPGQQAIPAERSRAIEVTDVRRLLGEAESILAGRRREQLEGSAGKTVERLAIGIGLQHRGDLVELLSQRSAFSYGSSI